MDPYVLFNLSPEADDDAIKTAYLIATRIYSPERYPELFELVRAAYETIATEKNRVAKQLFQTNTVDSFTLLCAALAKGGAPKIILANCSKLSKAGIVTCIEKNLENLADDNA